MKLVLSTHNITLTDGLKEHVRLCIEKLDHQETHALKAFVNLSVTTKGAEKSVHLYHEAGFAGAKSVARDAESDLYAPIW